MIESGGFLGSGEDFWGLSGIFWVSGRFFRGLRVILLGFGVFWAPRDCGATWRIRSPPQNPEFGGGELRGAGSVAIGGDVVIVGGTQELLKSPQNPRRPQNLGSETPSIYRDPQNLGSGTPQHLQRPRNLGFEPPKPSGTLPPKFGILTLLNPLRPPKFGSGDPQIIRDPKIWGLRPPKNPRAPQIQLLTPKIWGLRPQHPPSPILGTPNPDFGVPTPNWSPRIWGDVSLFLFPQSFVATLANGMSLRPPREDVNIPPKPPKIPNSQKKTRNSGRKSRNSGGKHRNLGGKNVKSGGENAKFPRKLPLKNGPKKVREGIWG